MTAFESLCLRAHAAHIRLQIRTASPTDQRLDDYQVAALELAKALEEAADRFVEKEA